MAATEAGLGSILEDLVRRLDELETTNNKLCHDNLVLKKRVDVLETETSRLDSTCKDLVLKVDVLREPTLRTAAQRVLRTYELLEQILMLCSEKQLFQLQRVSKTFHGVLQSSTPLLTRMYRNPKDSLSTLVDLSEQRHLWSTLRLNSHWKKTWKVHRSRANLDLRIAAVPEAQITYRITDDLVAKFEYQLTSLDHALSALEALGCSLGRSYVTQPALPTNISVSFLDVSILRHRQEYLHACRSPLEMPPNVTAQARIQAATVLEMLQVATMLHRYHREKWTWNADLATWTTAFALDEDRETMRLLAEKPAYSGWRALNPKSGHLVFET